MKRKYRAVTINDVAKASGVSVSTVSRVLNGKSDVSSDTQERILDVIDSLGFTSNLAARSMRSFRRNLVGLIMPDIGYPFAIEVMRGVNRAIAESDFDLLVYTTGDVRKAESAKHEQKYVSLLNNSITDGVIVVAPVASEFSTNGLMISIDPVTDDPGYPYVQATNYEGALEAMEYLLGLGHRRIGYIGGRTELNCSVRRLEGYRDSLRHFGIDIDESLILIGDFTSKMAIPLAMQLLTMPDPPTAIFASNDQSAMGVFEVAEELGIRIPDDLSLIGFDNIPESAYLNLTTIDQHICEMGYIAAQMLIGMINKDNSIPQIYNMKTNLVIRNSCKRFSAE